jgi:hypothetical protein
MENMLKYDFMKYRHCLKKQKKLNINIASIFITLTKINNETHDVAKKNKPPKKNKTKLLR